MWAGSVVPTGVFGGCLRNTACSVSTRPLGASIGGRDILTATDLQNVVVAARLSSSDPDATTWCEYYHYCRLGPSPPVWYAVRKRARLIR